MPLKVPLKIIPSRFPPPCPPAGLPLHRLGLGAALTLRLCSCALAPPCCPAGHWRWRSRNAGRARQSGDGPLPSIGRRPARIGMPDRDRRRRGAVSCSLIEPVGNIRVRLGLPLFYGLHKFRMSNLPVVQRRLFRDVRRGHFPLIFPNYFSREQVEREPAELRVS
jgi:hypothetical protein